MPEMWREGRAVRVAGVEDRPGIAVVGAGIGGLALAAALTASGTRCEVFERERRPAGDGAGEELAPNAVRPLRRLGLGPVLRACAVRVEATETRGWDGRAIARIPHGLPCERLFGAPYYTARWDDVHAALRDRVPAPVVHTGRTVTGLAEDGDGVTLYFADGTTHRASAVVGADGVRSAVRTAIAPQARPPRPTGLTVHHGLLPVERLPRAVARDALVRRWRGPGAHLVCYPVAGGAQVGFTATVAGPDAAEDGESWTASGAPKELVQDFGHWSGIPAQLATAAARGAGTVRRFVPHEREPLSRWATRRVTLLGDAAHPGLLLTPQGAAQTLEDAFDLAACLAGAPQDGLPAALARYAALRAERTAGVEAAVREERAGLLLPDGHQQRARDLELRTRSTLRNLAPLYGYEAGRPGQGCATAG
jgi:salicylate hydroxylase